MILTAFTIPVESVAVPPRNPSTHAIPESYAAEIPSSGLISDKTCCENILLLKYCPTALSSP
jgi:hypothetical protein